MSVYRYETLVARGRRMDAHRAPSVTAAAESVNPSPTKKLKS